MPFLWRQASPLRDGSVRWVAGYDSLAIPNVNSGRIFCYFRFQPHRPGGYLGDVLMLFFSPPVGPNAGGKCDSGAMAAHDLPKVAVGGSSPLYRSTHSSSSYNDYCFPLSSVTAWRACRESHGWLARMGSTPLPAQAKKMA